MARAGYADGFLVPLPKKNVEAYRRLAKLAAKVYLEHGALEYRELVGDDLAASGLVPFTATLTLKPKETVVLAWVLFKSRAHRDAVNEKVMADPRMQTPPEKVPFDSKRMVYGGFQMLIANGR